MGTGTLLNNMASVFRAQRNFKKALELVGQRIEVGDKVLLIASHCDPTVNLYDHYYPYRNDTVTELWPIAARGRSQ